MSPHATETSRKSSPRFSTAAKEVQAQRGRCLPGATQQASVLPHPLPGSCAASLDRHLLSQDGALGHSPGSRCQTYPFLLSSWKQTGTPSPGRAWDNGKAEGQVPAQPWLGPLNQPLPQASPQDSPTVSISVSMITARWAPHPAHLSWEGALGPGSPGQPTPADPFLGLTALGQK